MQSVRRFSPFFFPSPRRIRGQIASYVTDPDPDSTARFFPRFTMFGFWIFHRRRRSRTGRDHPVGGGSFGGGVYFGGGVFRVTRKLSSRETSSARIVDRRSRRLPARTRTLDGSKISMRMRTRRPLPRDNLSECPNTERRDTTRIKEEDVSFTDIRDEVKDASSSVSSINHQSNLYSHGCQNNSDSWTAARALEKWFLIHLCMWSHRMTRRRRRR